MTFSRTSCSPSEAAVAGTQLEMQFGDAKSDFRLHAFKSLGLHRNGSGQWRTHDHPWPKTESSVPVQRLFGRLDYRHQHGDEDQRKAHQ